MANLSGVGFAVEKGKARLPAAAGQDVVAIVHIWRIGEVSRSHKAAGRFQPGHIRDRHHVRGPCAVLYASQISPHSTQEHPRQQSRGATG